MDYLEFFYKRLTELRLQKGVSARDMSLSLGQSESYINKIENRRTLPSFTGFIYICDYFNISPQDFFNVDCANPKTTNDIVKQLENLSSEQLDLLLKLLESFTAKN